MFVHLYLHQKLVIFFYLQKDERDTAYAQQYFNRVKLALQDDRERFIKFLTLLRDVNKDHTSPVEVGLSEVGIKHIST